MIKITNEHANWIPLLFATFMVCFNFVFFLSVVVGFVSNVVCLLSVWLTDQEFKATVSTNYFNFFFLNKLVEGDWFR